MGSDGCWLQGSFWEAIQMAQLRLGGQLQNSANILKGTELYTLYERILCHVIYISIKILKGKNNTPEAETPDGST